MRILITGINSPLGRAVWFHAQKSSYEVVGTVSRRSGHLANGERKNIFVLDLEDTDAFKKIPEQIDAIVHVAAASEGAADYIMQSTGLGTWRLAKIAAQKKIKKIIHISSMSVYGSVTDSTVNSVTPIRHESPYGVAKWAAECYLKDVWAEIKSISIRSPAIVGKMAHRHFLARLYQAMKRKESQVWARNPDFLFNNLIHVEDFARFILVLLSRELPDYGAYPIAASSPIPLSEIVAVMVKKTQFLGRVIWESGGPTPFSIDYSELAHFGYKPNTTIDSLNRWLDEKQES